MSIYSRKNLWTPLRLDRLRDFVRVHFHPDEKVFLNLARDRTPIWSKRSHCVSRRISHEIPALTFRMWNAIFCIGKENIFVQYANSSVLCLIPISLKWISLCESPTRRCSRSRGSLWWSNLSSVILLSSKCIQEIFLVKLLYWIEENDLCFGENSIVQHFNPNRMIGLSNWTTNLLWWLSVCHFVINVFQSIDILLFLFSIRFGDLCRERRSSFSNHCELVFRQFHSSLIGAGWTYRDSNPSLRNVMLILQSLTIEYHSWFHFWLEESLYIFHFVVINYISDVRTLDSVGQHIMYYHYVIMLQSRLVFIIHLFMIRTAPNLHFFQTILSPLTCLQTLTSWRPSNCLHLYIS